ncbi:CHAT domain-containing protein [Streptomyces lavendofoliae]|uniref:CHAT domain-containing protein n=1 Tax=Streptomyces lavendofoliae TaxID=67314 RepID=UPI003D94F445
MLLLRIQAMWFRDAGPMLLRRIGEHFATHLRAGTKSHARYQTSREGAELDAAVRRLSQAVLSTHRGAWRRHTARNNLGIALLDRYRLGHDPRDLDEAARVLAVEPSGGPRDSPAEVRRLTNLLAALAERRGGPADAADIFALRRRLGSMSAAPDRLRIQALSASGYACAEAGMPAAGYQDLSAAVALLPRAAGWGRGLGVHQEVLSEHPNLAADATACAIAARQPARAIEMFETGRAVQWDQSLRRSIRAELRAVKPRLARKLDRAVARLEREGGMPHDPRMAVIHQWELVSELADTRQRRSRARAQRRWASLARLAGAALPEAVFEAVQFREDIRPAAAEGPVVAVVASRFGCYALIIRADRDEPTVVELTRLTYDRVQTEAGRYLTALNHSTGSKREGDLARTLAWLWSDIVSPVLAELDLTDGEDGPPRLWWCPAGALASLPLHAACADGALPVKAPAAVDAAHGDAVLDRAICSYTPTMRVLVSARRARDLRRESHDGSEQPARRLMLVSVADRPEHAGLPAAAGFRTYLAGLFPPGRLTRFEGPSAQCRPVAQALGQHMWAHFDCHGVQDPYQPVESGLVLHDRTLTIAELAAIRTHHPEFAFLAACTTALTHARIPDEMVSLASALQYSGYQHVIGTLSPVLDSAAARVARSVYESLTTAGVMRPEHSARELHRAVLAQRAARPRHPSTWVPFVHVGV